MFFNNTVEEVGAKVDLCATMHFQYQYRKYFTEKSLPIK